MKRYYFVKRDSEIVYAETEAEARARLQVLVCDESEWTVESVESA